MHACIKCAGITCVVDTWNGSQLCKTGLGNADCTEQGFCAGQIPPAPGPKPPKPILTIEANLYSVDTPVARPLKGVVSSKDISSLTAAVAKIASLGVENIHLRSANLTSGYEIPGDADEALGLAVSGHLFSASQGPDGVAHLKACYYTSTSGPIIVAGEADVAPGDALVSSVDLLGQSMILALRYTHYDEKEFSWDGAAIQERFRADTRANRDYPGFSLLTTIAPGPCAN